MKKSLALLFLVCIMLGNGTGFALQGPEEVIELDDRISEFFTGDFLPGDVKYLSDGKVVIQTFVSNDNNSPMTIRKVDQSGSPILGKEVDLIWESGLNGDAIFWNFLIEDINGNIYTNTADHVFRISSNFDTMGTELTLGSLKCDVESKDRSMLNLLRGLDEDEVPIDDSYQMLFSGFLAVSKYDNNQVPEEFDNIGMITSETISELKDFGKNFLMGADFGETQDIIYLLVVENESSNWRIIELSIDLDAGEDAANFTVLDVIEVDDSLNDFIFWAMEYDGEGFQLLGNNGPDIQSVLYRIDMEGEIVDKATLPGAVFSFDTNGGEAIVSVIGGSDSWENGYYKVVWEESASSKGHPNALIHERTMAGKTTATFRAGGYGLLRREDSETAVIDYLAPLKTEEREVRLRMPLCDVMAKFGENANNLEISYGEDRIRIPMTALAVQDLLSQMPCETDATIEIFLARVEDGSLRVKAELFVVEQVDPMTKVVHRMPILLP